MTALLELSRIDAYYGGSHVLHDISLTVDPGEVVLLIGRNGAGKTTLMRSIMGLVTIRRGNIRYRGDEIRGLAPHAIARLGIGLVPEDRRMFAKLTVAENLELGGWLWRADRARLRRGVEAALARYPVLADLRHRPAGSLSGGQQRTLEIARLLVTGPNTLLIDEPSAGLSPILASQVYRELATLKREGRTILLVDQDVRAAIEIADYVYVLNSGRNDVEGDRSAFEQGDLGAMVRGWLGM